MGRASDKSRADAWRAPALARRAAAFAVLGTAIVAIDAACGFDGLGAGPAPVDEAGAPAQTSSSDAAASAADGEAGDFESACTTERTVCSGVCTDTSSDPANCSGCGKACATGQSCNGGACDIICIGGTVACGGACVETKTDPANCGKCGSACGTSTPFCVNGLCVPDCGDAGTSATLCPATGSAPAFCANVNTDPKNCGACGTACAASQVCTGTPAACKSLCGTGSLPGDIFAPNMVGCIGKVGFASAATLCPAGTTVCDPAVYVARRAGKKPTYNYWTSVNLAYEGSDGRCSVDATGTKFYTTCNNPMRVCAGYTDPLGNKCNGKDCGYKTRADEYFGGCTNDTTAGALCCTP